jgi:hypothetical protein
MKPEDLLSFHKSLPLKPVEPPFKLSPPVALRSIFSNYFLPPYAEPVK